MTNLLKSFTKVILFVFLSITVILTTASASVVPASERSVDILQRFSAKMKAIPAFEMKFQMVVDGFKIVGTIQSQKESFKLTNSQIELYCNGKVKWIYNIDNKELTILANDQSQTDITENPLAFLTSLEQGYTYSEKALSGSASGKSVWLIELKPKNKRLAYKSITIGIEKSTLKPVSVQYLAKNGAKHIVDVTSFAEKSPWPVSYFTFPSSRMKGLSVTDLR